MSIFLFLTNKLIIKENTIVLIINNVEKVYLE